jgi:hypothetical protein
VLFLVHRFLSPWWRRRQVPPKRRFLQEPHGVTTQKTPFCFYVVQTTASASTGSLVSRSQDVHGWWPMEHLKVATIFLLLLQCHTLIYTQTDSLVRLCRVLAFSSIINQTCSDNQWHHFLIVRTDIMLSYISICPQWGFYSHFRSGHVLACNMCYRPCLYKALVLLYFNTSHIPSFLFFPLENK